MGIFPNFRGENKNLWNHQLENDPILPIPNTCNLQQFSFSREPQCSSPSGSIGGFGTVFDASRQYSWEATKDKPAELQKKTPC